MTETEGYGCNVTKIIYMALLYGTNYYKSA